MLYDCALADAKGCGLVTIHDIAKDDFGNYCRGKHFDELGMAAVFEWSLILSLLVSVTTLQKDFN